ncbi:MAG: BLUF domain-containing protein [Pseudomonadota bacterium]
MSTSFSRHDDEQKYQHGEHILLRLTYISRYNTHNEPGELQRILAQAQENNTRVGITGVLIFNHNFFLQSIEGRRPLINDLLRKLTHDPRHFSLQVIEAREIDQRRWTGWSMNYLTPGQRYQNEALRFSGGTSFNPYLMSTRQVMMLIESLTKLQEAEKKQQQAVQAPKRGLLGFMKAG